MVGEGAMCIQSWGFSDQLLTEKKLYDNIGNHFHSN